MNNDIEFRIELMKVLVKYNIIPDTHQRNEEIRLRYRSMRAEKIRAKTAIEILMDEYFLSYKNIESILYNKKKKYLFN